jgi:hypothetical protein
MRSAREQQVGDVTQAISSTTVVAPISAPTMVRSSPPMVADANDRTTLERGGREPRAGSTRAPSSAFA